MKDQLSCSEITKRKIAAALKELMQTTPFEKITVSDISNKCEMHRQTFFTIIFRTDTSFLIGCSIMK